MRSDDGRGEVRVGDKMGCNDQLLNRVKRENASADMRTTTHLQDISHILSMRVFPQEARSTNDDINAIYASFDSDSSIIHMTSDMSQNLALQTQLADGFTISSTLLRGGW